MTREKGGPAFEPDPRTVGPLRADIVRQPVGSTWRYLVFIRPTKSDRVGPFGFEPRAGYADTMFMARMRARAALRKHRRKTEDPGERLVESVVDRPSAWESFWSQLRGG